MSRNSTEIAPKVRADNIQNGTPFNEGDDGLRSQTEQAKVLQKENLHDISSPMYKKFSKVLLSESSRVLKPPSISEWTKVGSFPSPLSTNSGQFNLGLSFVSNLETILCDIVSDSTHTTISREFYRAGPRKVLAFNPKSQVKACIVTCGGLCPGINGVIRELVITLSHLYGVKEIWGIPFGYRGFYSTDSQIVRLTEDEVQHIHHEGGTILGSSRGGFDGKMICDAIESYGYNQVYIIGGDGTHRGALEIFKELRKRKAKVAVVGIPKTIDNDIALIDKSFGFDTAVQEAQRSIICAETEARSAINGIGLVKLMGRHSGQIAMFATLASRIADCCLIPEVHFVLEGANGLFQYIKDKLREKKFMVIVVAEGAAPDLLKAETNESETDPSGNVKLPDVGLWLSKKIKNHFKANNFEINLKLIDPTYEIRSVPANASDNLICGLLAQSGVHGAMHGFSGFSVGLINTHFSMIPMEEICERGRSRVDVRSRMWHRVIASTQQPPLDGSIDEASLLEKHKSLQLL